MFHQVCPDEEFLPTPPNPEDIIHVDDTESPVATGSNSEFESGQENSEEKKGGEIISSETTDQEKNREENQNMQETEGTSAEVMCDAEKPEEGEEKAVKMSKTLGQENES